MSASDKSDRSMDPHAAAASPQSPHLQPPQRSATPAPAEPQSSVDMQAHLDALRAKDLLVEVDVPVNKDTVLHPLVRWQYCGGIPEDERKGFLFTNVVDGKGRTYDIDVAVGVMAGNPDIYSVGMGVPIDQIAGHWLTSMEQPVDPVEVTQAPCQEIVVTGEDLTKEGGGLDGLPIPVSTPGYDVAPYFTAGCWVTKDPDNGIQNMGVYRGNLKSSTRVAVMMERATLAGGWEDWKKYRARGEKMPAAVVLGAPPAVEYCGPQKLPLDNDEVRVAGALAGQPVEVVRAKTVDLLVPAHAQVIVEGFIDDEYLEPEGPFGESHGYMSLEEFNMIFEVSAITRRRKAVITSLISQVTPSESSVIKKLAYEPIYLEHLRDHLAIKQVRQVVMHEPLTNLRAFLFIVFEHGTPKTEIWRALEGATSLQPAVGKFCIAVDEDIDPSNTDHVLWAMAFRCNPREDLVVLPYRSHGHAPAEAGMEIDSTVLINATQKGPMPAVALPKQAHMEAAKELWDSLGLPKLRPTNPWYGYSLGVDDPRWDEAAQRAAVSDWETNGSETWPRRRKMSTTNLPTSVVEHKPEKVSSTHVDESDKASGS